MGGDTERLAVKEQVVASREGYSVRAIANYFIDKSKEEAREVTHMKVQKLSYIAHGWCLALMDRPLMRDSVQAWEYGPVYPGLYHELKEYGKEPIDELICDLKVEDGDIWFVPASIHEEISDDADKHGIVALLDKVWEVYRKFTAIELSAMTHEKDTPWHMIVSEYPEVKQKSIPIPDELIRRHYRKLAER